MLRCVHMFYAPTGTRSLDSVFEGGGFQERKCKRLCACVCCQKHSCNSWGWKNLFLYRHRWMDREREREREVVKLFLSTLSFVLCLIPSLDHKLLLDTNTKWHIETKVYLSYTFTLLAPTFLLNLSFPSSSKLSFSLRHSSHFCPSLSSCYLVISALSFFLDFSHNLSSISSSWPPFPALSWFMAECCYCAVIFRKCKSVFIESTYIKYP